LALKGEDRLEASEGSDKEETLRGTEPGVLEAFHARIVEPLRMLLLPEALLYPFKA
jgi:hypothetical protein